MLLGLPKIVVGLHGKSTLRRNGQAQSRRIVNEGHDSSFSFDVPDIKLYWTDAKAGDS